MMKNGKISIKFYAIYGSIMRYLGVLYGKNANSISETRRPVMSSTNMSVT